MGSGSLWIRLDSFRVTAVDGGRSKNVDGVESAESGEVVDLLMRLRE